MRLSSTVWILFLALPLKALDLQPETVFLRGLPGEKIVTILSVTNDSSSPVRVYMETHTQKNGPTWLSLSDRSLRLKPGEHRVVRLISRIPHRQGEEDGEVWARLYEKGALSETRVIRRVNARVAGTEVLDARLEDIQTRVQDNMVKVSVDLENRGNVSLRPKLVAELIRRDGTSTRVVRDLTGTFLPPGAVVNVDVETPLPQGQWNGEGTLSAYYRDVDGKTTQVIKKIEDVQRAIP